MPKTEFGYYISLGICYCYLVAKSCPTLLQPHGLCLSGFSVHGFPRQEHWSRLPFPSPGDLPDTGIESRSPALEVNSLPLVTGEAHREKLFLLCLKKWKP